MNLWEVEIYTPPSGREKRGYLTIFMTVGLSPDDAMETVREHCPAAFIGATEVAAERVAGDCIAVTSRRCEPR